MGLRRRLPLETNKGLFLRTLAEVGLNVPPHIVLKGLTNLRLHLQDAEDVYVKISKFRGDTETLHWTSYDQMEGALDAYAVRFGPLKELITFYVFDAIDTEIEDGIDAYRAAGQWPKTILHGYEQKDKAYIGAMQKFEDTPEEVRHVSEAIAPVLDRMTGDGAMKFSTEVRITKDGESYFIDPTCRFGSPPSQGECCLIKNLGEIIYHGAMGELVEPDTEDEFVVQAHVSLEGDRTDWNCLKLDGDVAKALKGGFCCQVNSLLALPPITEYHSSEVGYLCATGPTLAEAIERLRDLKDKLPDGTKCEFASLADLLREIQGAEDKGMELTSQPVPDPAIVMEES